MLEDIPLYFHISHVTLQPTGADLFLCCEVKI